MQSFPSGKTHELDDMNQSGSQSDLTLYGGNEKKTDLLTAAQGSRNQIDEGNNFS